VRAASAITRATVRQALPTRRAIVFIIAEASPALVYLILASTLSDEAAALERLMAMVITLYFPILLPIVSLVIASSVLGGERRDGTLSFVVLRPIPRWLIAAAKIGAALIVAGGLNALGALALGGVYGLETGAWGLVLAVVVGGLVATAVYAAVFVPLGFFTDRAVLVALIFVFVFENGAITALSGLSALSPWRIGFSAFVALAPAGVAAEALDFDIVELTSLFTAAVRTGVVVAASVAFIAFVLRQRDLASE